MKTNEWIKKDPLKGQINLKVERREKNIDLRAFLWINENFQGF